MKKFITSANSSPDVRIFIEAYQTVKGYERAATLSYGDVVELRRDLNTVREDEEIEAGRFYNYVLYGPESTHAHNSYEPIEDEYAQLEQDIVRIIFLDRMEREGKL